MTTVPHVLAEYYRARRRIERRHKKQAKASGSPTTPTTIREMVEYLEQAKAREQAEREGGDEELDAQGREKTMTNYTCFMDMGHLFVVFPEGTFLVDTGSPTSFGRVPALTVEGQRFPLASNYMGMLSADRLKDYVGRDMDGLIGGDILSQFDVVIDIPASQMGFSTGEVRVEGEEVPLSFLLGVPKLTAHLGAQEGRQPGREAPMSLFFDTGASITYVSGTLAQYPAEGSVKDFYPMFGEFTTDTYRAPLRLGQTTDQLRCGQLPSLLGLTLKLAGTEGIVGNELLQGRKVGYFPRRSVLTLGDRN